MKHFRNTLLTLSLFFLLSLAVIITPANATTTQIFSDNAEGIHMDDGKVAWSASDGIHGQIYIYDINSGITIHTNDLLHKGVSSIDDGKVVGKCRQDNTPGNFICIYTIENGNITQVNAHASTISQPQIEGNKVVWITFDNDYGVYLYDILSGTTTRIGDTSNANNDPYTYGPQINEGKIIWNNAGLYLYDIASERTTQVSNTYTRTSSPQQISNGKVVWDSINPDTQISQIYVYDIATQSTTLIDNPSTANYDPRINDGKIVYGGFADNAQEIYLYDIATGDTTQLTANRNGRFRAQDGFYFKDGKIVWGYYGSPVSVYDLITGTLTKFSDGYNEYPSTSNGKVAWRHCDEYLVNCEILLWKPNAPEVSVITAPVTPVLKDTTINTSATFTYPNPMDTHTAIWDWGDGTTTTCPPNAAACTLTEANGSGSVTGAHAYTAPGTYTITLKVTDNTGAFGISKYQYITVYDNHTDSVSGSVNFDTPEGSIFENYNASGKTSFGFSAQYDDNGNVIPQNGKWTWAQLTFDNNTIRIEFLATAYQSLTVNGTTAILKGTGTVNNQPGYTVLVSAKEETQGGNGFIRYRIKDSSGTVIYDTQPGAADNAEPTTPVTKGKIKIN